MKFIDEAKIDIEAGHGGPGCISFRREKFVPRGGPDGGDGGKGGDVVFEATTNMTTLLDFRYKKLIQAKNGQNGMGSQKNGRDGEDAAIPVPVGTVIFDESNGDVLADFTEHGQKVVLAKGGRGGKGNAFFVSSTRQAPKFAQEGEEGEQKSIRMELRLLADVGLVGFPNAGKSTFLSKVSSARPKVADYPFTTLQPCLGVVKHKDSEPFVISDLPGLIEGAHEGKGMGDRFLKHAQRTRALLHLVSLSPFESESPVERYRKIESEVENYFGSHPGLEEKSNRETLVLLTQADLRPKDELDQMVGEFVEETGVKPLVISSATGQNVDQVLDRIISILKDRS